ncbi:ATP-binding protein [Sphingomicrobium sp. XHP0235]|uniref:HAMP domain-containing sensor histidine kinase n=1 Tax=Sphingomicrobium aquimarinum TaxID=3133971 RepID=UPI0031FF0E2B
MNRLSLRAQITLVVLLALLVSQAVSLSLALDNRRDQMMERAVRPAAERIAILLADPERLERRAAISDRLDRVGPLGERRAARGFEGEGRRGGRRAMLSVAPQNPLPANPVTLAQAEMAFRTALAEAGVDGTDARAVRLPPRPRGRGDGEGRMLLALPIADGRWVSVPARAPAPIAPVFARLLGLHLLIGLLIIVPTLFLLARVSGSLKALVHAAERFSGQPDPQPVPEKGPRDIAQLIAAMNAMQARIATMISEKDVMLGAIGHDLRTPLTALRLEAEAVDDAERRAALVDQIERLHAQFEAILDLARASRSIAPDARIDPHRLLSRAALRDDVTLADLPPLPPIAGDEASLDRALANLIDNGLRHGTGVALDAAASIEGLVITVRDDGPGIPASERDRLRQPFERAEASRNRVTGGHGLGLAIVDAIMRRHGGRLELADRADGQPGLEARMIFPSRL